jgi:PKD repeat protein
MKAFVYKLIGGNSLFYLILLFSIVGKLCAQVPVSGFNSNTQSGCAPLSVNFVNTSTGSSSYLWDFGNGNFSSLANPQNVYVQPGTYTVRLIAISANGSRDTLLRTNYITAAPGPVLSVSVDSYTGCNNYSSFQFTCSSPTATSIAWDFGDGSNSTLFNPIKNFTNPGNYSISVLATNSAGCQSVASLPQQVQVMQKPIASFTVNNNTTCDVDEAFQFTPSPITSNSYAWDFHDGTFSNAVSPSHVFAYSGVFSVELKVTNAFGCADSITLTDIVTVHPDNTPVISATTFSGCLPLASTLSSNVVGAISYQWNSSDGQTATTSDFSVTYFPAGTYEITLAVVMPNGCSYSSPSPSYIQVNPKPTATFTASNISGCAPLLVNIENTSLGATNYYWTFGDGGYSFDTVPQYSYTQPGNYTITLKAYNQFGCWRTMTVNNVEVNAPEITASIENSTGCPPLTPVFNNTSLNAVSYLWDFGDGTTSTDSLPIHTYSELGSYAVSLVAFGSGGCTDTLVFPGGVNVSAQLANYPSPAPLAGCAPFTTSFGLNDPSIISFTWDFGDGTISNLSNPTHTYTSPGTYIVSLQINHGSICGLSYPNYQTITVEGITPEFEILIDPCPPHEVHFTDTISDANSWNWDFGDGSSSNLQNPSHIYPTTNNYHVGLTITTPSGCTRTYVGFNAVTFTDFQPSFVTTYSPSGIFPLNVNFSSSPSNASSWLWDFGDGSTSTQQNPSHSYQADGNYTVTLTAVVNGCTLSVIGAPFNIPSNPNQNGNGGSEPPVTTNPENPFVSCAPAAIAFYKQSPDHQIIAWNFGDGTTSTIDNPTKIYTTPGLYTISYQANTSAGVQTITYPQSIHIGGYIPDINITTSANCSTFFISTDLNNSALFNQVQWVFGSSSPYNGVQVDYQTPLTNESINIRAVVTDTLGCNAIRNQNILMDKPVPFVAYPTTVCRDSIHFFQLGNTNGLSFFWQFGNGDTSIDPEPVYQYDSTGVYTVRLTIITALGCSTLYVLPQQITFAAPRMDMIINGNWSACAPHDMQLIFPGQLSYVNYVHNGIFLTNSDTLNLHFPDSTTYTGLMMVATTTWISGCRDTLNFDTIHVYDAFADFTFSQDADCFPITASFVDQSPDAVSWLWDFGNGVTSTDQNPVITFTETPADSVKLIITTSHGCTDTIIKPNIIIYQIYQNSVSYGACNPLIVNFSAVDNLNGQFEWYLGIGEVLSGPSFQYTYIVDGVYNPYVVGISPSGCRDTSFISFPVMVTSITADFSSPSPAACSPSIVEFLDESLDAVSWEWDFGDNSGSSLQNPVKLYNSPGVYTIRLIVTSQYGCKDTLIRPNFVTVLGPATAFNIEMPEGCVGSPIQFTDVSLGSVEWEWNFGEGSTSNNQNPTFIYNEPGNYAITLFSRDTLSCSGFATMDIPFIVHDRPQAGMSIQNLSGCAPFTPEIINTSSGATQFEWNFGDGSAILSDSVPIHSYTSAGSYSLNLIALNDVGCADTLQLDSLHALMVPTAHLSLNNAEGCGPLTVEFTNQSTNLIDPTYQLFISDSIISTNPDIVLPFDIPGFYSIALHVENANGCADTISYPQAILVYDSIPPSISPIQRVSVESPNSVIIEWTENYDNQFSHYNILRRTSGNNSFSMLTTINDPHTVVYYDSLVNTFDSVYCYKVEVVNLCGQKVSPIILQEHCTINVNAVARLNNIIDIDWTPYVGRVPGAYIVLRTDESANLTENLGVISGDSTHFADITVVCPVKYRYDILAIELDGILHLESKSDFDIPNIITNPFLSQLVNIGRSTVLNNEKILTEWSVPDTLQDDIISYSIYRKEIDGAFELISNVPPAQHYYIDSEVDVNKTKYVYQIVAENSCNSEAGFGVTGDNIVLSIDQKLELYNLLEWTPYLGWGEAGVDFYIIEEQKSDGTWISVDSVPGTINSYFDENQ